MRVILQKREQSMINFYTIYGACIATLSDDSDEITFHADEDMLTKIGYAPIATKQHFDSVGLTVANIRSC